MREALERVGGDELAYWRAYSLAFPWWGQYQQSAMIAATVRNSQATEKSELVEPQHYMAAAFADPPLPAFLDMDKEPLQSVEEQIMILDMVEATSKSMTRKSKS